MKKGFTLLELLISLTLLSIVMLFMTNFIVNLRDKENELIENFDINLMVNQTEISKYLNEEIIKNDKITAVECTSTLECNITYGNGSEKTLQILSNGKTIKYYDNNKIYFVKTLKNGRFNAISYVENTIDVLKVSLSNSNYDIEAYSY